MLNQSRIAISRTLRITSIGLYAASFIVPDSIANGTNWFLGTTLFMMGLLYFWLFWLTFAWWANVLFWIALCSHPRTAGVWSYSAGLLASTFLVFLDWRGSIGPPFFLWSGSMFLFAFANSFRLPAEEFHPEQSLDRLEDSSIRPDADDFKTHDTTRHVSL
jgi:hypothetical protein